MVKSIIRYVWIIASYHFGLNTLSKQSDHENATCKSFHSGKTHSDWLLSQCGGCEENHPWWTHGEWHHQHRHFSPLDCSEAHPSHSHEEFEHKGIKCEEFHPYADHDDWNYGNGLNTAEEAEVEHDQLPCESVHFYETHAAWDDAKDHPGTTCDEEHREEDHDEWEYQRSLSPRELKAQEREAQEYRRHQQELRKERDEKATYQLILILGAIVLFFVIVNQLAN